MSAIRRLSGQERHRGRPDLPRPWSWPGIRCTRGMSRRNSSTKTKTVAVDQNAVMNSLADAGYVELVLPGLVLAAFFYTLFELTF